MAQSEDQLLKQILDRLVPAFQPSKVVLFGSRAKGTAKKDSDYDFIFVVKKKDKLSGEMMLQASDLARDLGVVVEVFFFTEAEYQDQMNNFGSIPETATFEGQKVLLDVSQ